MRIRRRTGLDVERLARAYALATNPVRRPPPDDVDRSIAARIAREYAALESPSHHGPPRNRNELLSALARHREPHVCTREGPSAACDFNRFRERAVSDHEPTPEKRT